MKYWYSLPIIIIATTYFGTLLFLEEPSLLPAAKEIEPTVVTHTPVAQEPNFLMAHAEETAYPLRLTIPKIKVNALLEGVGLAPDGAMASPTEPANPAWFNLAPQPGEIGTAIIAGHYGRKDGHGSVFNQLYKLRIGDRLSVEDSRGNTHSFIVTGYRRYDQDADAARVFSSNDGKAHLNLITCEGKWSTTQKSYPTRLVVFTDKE